MANQFITLPVPAPAYNTSEVGAAVSVATLGALKTLCVEIPARYIGNLEVQFANDSDALVWNSIKSFPSSEQHTFDLVAQWVRVAITNFREGDLPTVTIAGETAAPVFANLPTVVGGGTGAAVDCSTWPALKTISVGGTYTGDAALEASNDGVLFYNVHSFRDSEAFTTAFTAQWLRVTHTPSSLEYPGTALVDIGSVSTGGDVATPLTCNIYTHIISGATRTSYSDTVPLVVGAFAFSTENYYVNAALPTFEFRAVAANGEPLLISYVELYNLTENEVTATLTVTDTASAKYSAVLASGLGAGELRAAETLYEVRVFLDADPLGVPTKTIELYSAHLVVNLNIAPITGV